jgi:glutamate:Na+ symporter, ESS family
MISPLQLEGLGSFSIGVVALLSGKYLNSRIRILRHFTIHEAVSGGILFALGFNMLSYLFQIEPNINLSARDLLILYFFTSVGLNARFYRLKSGGRSLALLFVATVFFMLIQNVIGVFFAKVFGLHAVFGLIGGTVSLIGGHGTTIAWAPTFIEEFRIDNVLEIGTAFSTAGLVLASLLGGVIGKFLIKKYDIKSHQCSHKTVRQFQVRQRQTDLDCHVILRGLLVLNIAILCGVLLNQVLNSMGLKFPLFVSCLFVGIIMTNIVSYFRKDLPCPSDSPFLKMISELSLGVFITMSLMSLQICSIVPILGPMVVLLLLQFLFSIFFTVIVIFRLMGRNYEAAVVCSGFGGISLGATPTAMANMSAITRRYGAAYKAVIIVPLVSAFLIDIANVLMINIFLFLKT